MTTGDRSTVLTTAESNLLQVLSARWAMHALLALHAFGDPGRFSELREALPGISNRVLSSRLADLERNGLVSREVTATRPVTITYCLTAHGHQVAEVLSGLRTVVDDGFGI